MRVVIDTTDRSGAQLASTPAAGTRFAAATQERAIAEADARIEGIIRSNAPAARVPRARSPAPAGTAEHALPGV